MEINEIGVILPRPKGKPMKKLLFCILDSTPKSQELLRTLSKEGYNGTVMNTVGMHHVLPKLNGGAAISLSTMVEDEPRGNLTLFIIIEEDEMPKLKERIRELTNNFEDIKGGMFGLPLESFEGTF